MNIKLIYLIFIIPVLVVGLFISQAFTSKGEEDTAENLYQEYCASCHGVKGNGYGDFAYLVYPKPRDFTNGVFKIRSTPAGIPPTDKDLFNTIHKGLPGTAMPPFNFLNDQEIKWKAEQIPSRKQLYYSKENHKKTNFKQRFQGVQLQIMQIG